MIDKQRLLIKALTSIQERVGADAVPPHSANDVIDILGLGGKILADVLDKAQHDGLMSRRWGGFIAISHSGRELARGPAAAADVYGQLELALAEMATAAAAVRRQQLPPLLAAEQRNLVDEVRATVVGLSDPEGSVSVSDHLERIVKSLARIGQAKNLDKKVIDAAARLSEAVTKTSELTGA